MILKDVKGISVIIGRFAIRTVGASNEVWDMRKLKNKDGSPKMKDGKRVIEPARLSSHGYLTWSLKNVVRVGNKSEKTEAQKHIDILNKKTNKIKTKNNDDYMVEYREIEKKYIANGFK